MGYKGNSVQGEIPESGAIFMSNINTHKECLKRKLFGLPPGMSNFVLHVKEGMTLFLFEFERRLLYGVYRATCDGEINIEPKAFRSSGKKFPAQVRFTTVWECSPLAETEFKDVIRDNYFSGKKFNFGLNEKQVRKLVKLFRSNYNSKIYPERNIRRYDDKQMEENARSGYLRKDIRHRIRFGSCDSRVDEVKEVDDNMYINKHIIEARHKDKREGLLTHCTTERDEFGDYSRHDILGKHFDHRENNMEDGYTPVSSTPHGMHFDEIGAGSSDILMDGENKDIADYKRLRDEYNVREGFWGGLNDHMLTNRDNSPFNQNDYLNCDPTRIDVPDIQLSPSCYDDRSSFIPISNSFPLYSSPEKIPRTYYPHDEGSFRYLDDAGAQGSIYPKFISRNLSSDAGLRVREVDPADKRFHEKHETKRSFGTTRKRASVFSRLSSALRHKEQASETDEKHELNSSVDKVMKMLEKVVSSPKKRRGKNISVIKQDDADNLVDSKIEDYELPDVNMTVDAEMACEKIEEKSVYQETRLVDFKRRKKSNKRVDDASKENFSESLVGATSDVGSVAIDELTGMPHKRRKLARPAFVKKNVVSNSLGAHENTLSPNDSEDVVLETSEMGDACIKSMVPTCHENTPGELQEHVSPAFVEKNLVPDGVSDHENTLSANDTDVIPESSEKVDAFTKSPVPACHEITLDGVSTKAGSESSKKVDASIKSMMPTCHENTPDDSNSTKAGSESSKKVDASIKPIDLNMLPTSDDSSSSKDDNGSTKILLETQTSGNEGDGNAESRIVLDVFAEETALKDDQKMCGWIEW